MLDVLHSDLNLADSKQLRHIFMLAVESVHLDLVTSENILKNVSEDLFECCPESQLKALFPILEELLHGQTTSGKGYSTR